VGLQRQYDASFSSGGMIGMVSGAIDYRPHLLELPSPRRRPVELV
jgi:hypothetical protein